MNTKSTIESRETDALLNFSSTIDPHIFEQQIRAAAQRELARAIARTVKVGFNSIASVLKDAADLQKKHGNQNYGAV